MHESLQRSGRGMRVLIAVLVVAVLGVVVVFGVSALGGTTYDATPTGGSGGAGLPPGTTPTKPTATAGATQAAAASLEVGMYDISFSPNLLTIPVDTPVTLVVVNHGVIAHNFSITDHKNPGVKNPAVSLDIAPGATESVTIDAPASTYYFYCDEPGHEQAGMFGYLQVEPGAAVAAEAATVTAPAGH